LVLDCLVGDGNYRSSIVLSINPFHIVVRFDIRALLPLVFGIFLFVSKKDGAKSLFFKIVHSHVLH
jgi:hypothetical protein